MIYTKFCICGNLLTTGEIEIGRCQQCQLEYERKWRSSKVCGTCGVHTTQKLINNKWVCKECGTEQ